MTNGLLRKIVTAGALIASTAALAACSGGGGGGATSTPVATVTPTPPPSTTSAPIYTSGVFDDSGLFEARCEVPRSGVDIEGNAFTDQAGSTLEENFWLRSWTNETYLWPDEVPDRNPGDFDNRLDYFAILRTTATTASGEDRDDFHFSEPTEEFLERRNSAASASYGVSYVSFSSTVPRDFRVRYTEPNSPASQVVNGVPNFQRGARILEVDGIDLVSATSQTDVDTLNAGLFPATPGETHTFVVQDVGSNSSRTITLTSQNLSASPVNRMSTIDTPTGKVGYILFNTFSPFSSEEQIANAMSDLSDEGVNDLILDLRYNGGGLLAVAGQLSYMIAGDAATSGKTFELLRFQDAAGNRNPVTGEVNAPIPFYSTGLGFSLANGTPLESLDLPRVFILSTARTCSASEAVINGLRGIDVEIVLIGDTTCGKPFGFYPTDNCGETYYTIQFQGTNDKGFGDYTDGFAPQNASSVFPVKLAGCSASDDYTKELGDTSERLLATALSYRENSTCPIASATARIALALNPVDDEFVDGVRTGEAPAQRFFDERRDLRLPE